MKNVQRHDQKKNQTDRFDETLLESTLSQSNSDYTVHFMLFSTTSASKLNWMFSNFIYKLHLDEFLSTMKLFKSH